MLLLASKKLTYALCQTLGEDKILAAMLVLSDEEPEDLD